MAVEPDEIIHQVHWLEIQRGSSVTGYPRGTPILSIHTKGLKAIRIYRYCVTVEGVYCAPKDITGAFLRFQRKCRRWLAIRRKAFQWVRARELGHIVHNLTDLYDRRLYPALRGLNQPLMRICHS